MDDLSHTINVQDVALTCNGGHIFTACVLAVPMTLYTRARINSLLVLSTALSVLQKPRVNPQLIRAPRLFSVPLSS